MSHPVEHYRRNADAYSQIDSVLTDVKDEFLSSDRPEQRRKILRSVEFALISVQTPLSVAERAYARVAQAESSGVIKDALSGVNYNKQKFEYIIHNREEVPADEIDDVVDRLEAGEPHAAQERTDEVFKGVGIVKSGFALAMLGFKDCMCTDTNVIQSVDFDVDKSYSDIDEYRDVCERIMEYYDELSSEWSNFVVQWIIFDAMRERGVAQHGGFFHTISERVNLPRQAGLGAFQ